MSGRIGMSLASTVSRVIDVPATHSSGVERTWPAWTDAISSSVEAKMRAADVARCSASFGWTTAPGRSDERRPTTASDAGRRRRPCSSAARRRPGPRPIAEARVDDRQRATTTARRADGRHQDERDEQAAEDGPGVLDGEQRARLRARPRSPRRAAAPTAVGNAMPSTIVTGSTTRTTLPNSARSVSSGLPGSSGSGRPRTPTRPTSASAATSDLGRSASSRTGRAGAAG